MALPANVTDPGMVNVEDQAFNGLPVQVPPFVQIPATTSPNNALGSTALPTGIGVSAQAPAFVQTPATTGPNQADGDDPSQVRPVEQAVNQPIQVGLPQVAGTTIQGGTASPLSANVITTTQNNVAGQRYGTGTPANVFV